MTPHDLGGGLGGACRPPSFGAEGVGRNKAAVNLLLSGSVASDAVTDPKAALALHSRIVAAVGDLSKNREREDAAGLSRVAALCLRLTPKKKCNNIPR